MKPQGETVYNVGLIGCGRKGWIFDAEKPSALPMTHAGAFSSLPNAKLVAGANRGRERLEAFGRRYGVTGLYGDYHRMLEEEKLDIVCIATHPGEHAEIVTSAAKAGVKGILCEKPMALSLGEADSMIEISQRNNLKLLVNHSLRWYPHFRKAKELVEQGVIGKLTHVSASRLGGKPDPAWQAEEEGPLLHDAVHEFDMFRFLAGDVKWVCGTALRKSRQYRVEDDSVCIFEFKNGVSGVAIVDELSEYWYQAVELYGTHGKILLALGERPHLWMLKKGRYEPETRFQWFDLAPAEFPSTHEVSPMVEAAKELIMCIEQDREGISTGRDGRAALEIIMAIYESQRRGNARVELPLGIQESVLHVLRQENIL